MRRPFAIAAAVLFAPLGAAAVCTTVDGAPAATSESMVLGMLRQMEARDEAGLRKFLDTGQALLLRGGNAVEILERRPGSGTVLVRRGPNQLSFWTLEAGVACDIEPPRTQP